MTLLAHYRLNNDLIDATGNGHDGSGTITYATGQIGQCGYSDGTKYADIGTLGNFGSDMDLGFSLTFWIKNNTSPGAIDRIMGVQNAGDTTAMTINTRRAVAGDLDIFTRDPAGNRHWFYTTATTGYNDNAWHHVAIVCATTFANSRIYVDGVSKALTSGDFDATFAPTNFDRSCYLFSINNAGSRVGTLVHLLDDVRFWSDTLADWQVASIYNLGRGTERFDPWRKTIGGVYIRRTA